MGVWFNQFLHRLGLRTIVIITAAASVFAVIGLTVSHSDPGCDWGMVVSNDGTQCKESNGRYVARLGAMGAGVGALGIVTIAVTSFSDRRRGRRFAQRAGLDPAGIEPGHVPPPPRGAALSGWYLDPVGRFRFRYWDSAQWTEHVANDNGGGGSSAAWTHDRDPVTGLEP